MAKITSENLSFNERRLIHYMRMLSEEDRNFVESMLRSEYRKIYIGLFTMPKEGLELAKSVSERLAGDAKAVAELGSDFSTEAQKLGEESVKAVTEKVA